MSLAIEAAELMEHFQCLTAKQSRGVANEPKKLAEVADEPAVVLCYLLALANELRLDLSAAPGNTMFKNAPKYPADQHRVRLGPNDPNHGDEVP